MLTNYIKIAFRNLLRYRAFSFINIVGVAIGLACFLLIALYVRDEVSYDRSHAKADRIYRLTRTFINPADGSTSLKLAAVAPPFGPLIKEDFPEVQEVVRIQENSGLLKYGEHSYNEDGMFVAEANLFKVFDFKLLRGNPARALVAPFSILFSRPMAEKYFGKQDPIGKIVRLDNTLDFTVTGVFEPLPTQSHFHPQFLLSFSSLNDNRLYGAEGLRSNWGNNSFPTYLLLAPNANPDKIAAAFSAFQDRHLPIYQETKPSKFSLLALQKLTDIHLKSHTDAEIEPAGDIQYVYLFSAIGLFILLIACINYMNLATARSASRAKEVGLRKVVGAVRSQLIGQFLSESMVLVTLALLLAVALVRIGLPHLNAFVGKELSMSTLWEPTFLLLILGATLLTGLLAGSYPAFFLTSFQPVRTLKGKLLTSLKGGRLRQTLVVAQFAIAVVLMISTAVVYNQMKYVQDYKLGYQKDQIVLLRTIDDTTVNAEAFKQELKRNSAVVEVGRSSRIPSGRLLDSWDSYVMKGDSLVPTRMGLKSLSVDHEFIPTYGMELAAGRNFSRAYTTDDTAAFILNETAVRELGWKSPQEAIGKAFGYGSRRGQVVGVTKDFHFESLHQALVPVVMLLNAGQSRWLSIHVAPGSLQNGLTHIENTWKKYYPERPYSYEFLDQRFGRLYVREQTQQTLFGIFAGIAILISCLGLFGLSMFMAEQRTKEIGVRKVLGASVSSLVILFSRDFLKLVVIALLLASPLAWYIMNHWLTSFAYRTSIHWSVFAVAGMAALLIALLTISFQSIKAALMNPVKSLRAE
ncbi:ABC transporter permease [Tellurirhabdus bombi]|uniref:ABC transporter permease n=1 Tax=Tellurirhabdus bombi TaxID=2907205 RepID=UPI001F483A20|nr:ABC transporter permease [Tellurirhabdus bombi]